MCKHLLFSSSFSSRQCPRLDLFQYWHVRLWWFASSRISQSLQSSNPWMIWNYTNRSYITKSLSQSRWHTAKQKQTDTNYYDSEEQAPTSTRLWKAAPPLLRLKSPRSLLIYYNRRVGVCSLLIRCMFYPSEEWIGWAHFSMLYLYCCHCYYRLWWCWSANEDNESCCSTVWVPGDIPTRSVIDSLFLPRPPFRSVPSLESLSLPLLSSLRATARLQSCNVTGWVSGHVHGT